MGSMGSAIVAEMIATTIVATMVATTAVATITATKTVDLHTVVFVKLGRSRERRSRRSGWSGWSPICPTEYSTLLLLTGPKGSIPTGLTGSVVSIVPIMVSIVLGVSFVSDFLLVCF